MTARASTAVPLARGCARMAVLLARGTGEVYPDGDR
jgi:hypothetical protein